MPSSDLYEPSRGYLVNDTVLVKADVSVCTMYDRFIYDSRNELAFVHLKNRGATCYMNSLIKTYFRNVVCHMASNKKEFSYESVLLGLQSLLCKLEYYDSCVATDEELAKYFGWEAHDSFLQHDVQGLNRFLSERHVDRTKGAAVEGTIRQLFEDVHYAVKCCCDMYASFCKYIGAERQEGDKKYHGLQDLCPLRPGRSEENILLFFALHNLKEEKLCVLRCLLIKASGKPQEIVTKPSEMAEFTLCEEIELHGARVKFAFASISYKYYEEQTLGMLHPRLQLRKDFCRSSSSSKCFASLGHCSTSWIMTLWSLYLRNLCPFIFRFFPEFITLSPGLLNKFREEHVHPPLIEIAAGKSTELPREILMDIFALLEIPDLVRAGSVCSSWNSAYTSLCNIGQYKQSQTPCLLYTSESAGENVACLYSLAEKRTYSLTLPEPPIHRRYLIGSSLGWLVTVDERSEMHLVNPITCEQIALPSVITIELVKPIYDDKGAICKYHYHNPWSVSRRPLTLDIGKLRRYFHKKALVFYETSSGMYIVVFIHHPAGHLVFARLGDDKWTRVSSHTCFEDCIYKDGLLFAVTSFGEIIAFDLSGSVVTTKIVLDRVKNHSGSMRFYIVQAPWGDLLQVWREGFLIKDDEHHRRMLKKNIKWMKIYKVCTVAKKLVQIDSLDGYVLFLGRNQSICSRAEEYPQLKPNHVYFTDDDEGMPLLCEWGYRLKIGALNYGNNSIDEIIPSRPWSNCVAPLLIIPNPRKMDSALHI